MYDDEWLTEAGCNDDDVGAGRLLRNPIPRVIHMFRTLQLLFTLSLSLSLSRPSPAIEVLCSSTVIVHDSLRF